MVKPPHWPDWLIRHPARRCAAKSKQRGAQCRKIAVPGRRVCVVHGGKSLGPRVVRFDCRRSAIQAKVERSRTQWLQRGSGAAPPGYGSSLGAGELTARDIASLLLSRENS
jgi:hypothetical protein